MHLAGCQADDFFEPELSRMGYSGHYWQKPCSPAMQYGYPCDGVAIFYKKDRFEQAIDPSGNWMLPHVAGAG